MTIFEYFRSPHPWFDTGNYAPYQIVLFLTGALLWVGVYVDTIKSITKKRTLNIPLIAICLNFGFEVTTSFTFVPDMGNVLVMAYWAWMILDIFIVISMFKYGYKQIRINYILKNLTSFLILGLLAGFFTQFFFIHRYDLPMAPLAGYMINLVMSVCFIYLVFIPGYEGNSLVTAWAKFLGTGLISIMFFTKYPDNNFLTSLYVFTAIFDISYIYLLYKVKITLREKAH
ncbi:MAG: hypothetical protein EPN37_08875 [Chitinophagaceae bacterium]|nr:MAG: hypothetical protein EPN37_08875 [Chitinophagaceae bacterium]